MPDRFRPASSARTTVAHASIWTDDLVTTLKVLFAENYSAAAIAEQLGAKHGVIVSRSAVIGKLHRIGLRSINGSARKTISRPTPIAAIVRRCEPVQTQPLPKLRVITCAPREIAFADLENDRSECRYPTNSAESPGEYLFCGLPVKGDGCSWCEHHAGIVFVPREKRTPKKTPMWRAA